MVECIAIRRESKHIDIYVKRREDFNYDLMVPETTWGDVAIEEVANRIHKYEGFLEEAERNVENWKKNLAHARAVQALLLEEDKNSKASRQKELARKIFSRVGYPNYVNLATTKEWILKVIKEYEKDRPEDLF